MLTPPQAMGDALHGEQNELGAESVDAALSPKLSYALCVLSAGLYVAAFPGVDLWPLALLAQAPLLLALHGQTPRRAAWIGWVSGILATVGGFYWLTELLGQYGGFPLPISVLFTVLLCGYQALRFALCGWLYARASGNGWSGPLAFVAAFVSSELVVPMLFPWYFAACVHDVPPLLQLAELGGPIAVSVVLLLPNLAVAELLRPWVVRTSAPRVSRRLVGVGFGAFAIAWLYGGQRILAVQEAMKRAEVVKVGIVQGNLGLGERRDVLGLHVQRTRALQRGGADLVVWSEAAVSGGFEEERHREQVRELVGRHLGVPTVIGTVLHRRVGEGYRYVNTALLTDRDGAVVGRYDKRYRLMFGEYLPFGDTFPFLYELSPHSGRFDAGTELSPLPLGEHRLAATICYEEILPGYVNDLVRATDADLLVNLTNDTWFGDTTEPWQHLALAKLRSVEHRLYMVRATNTGVSAVIDPIGRVRAQGPMFEEASLLAEARYMRLSTPYRLLGDRPWWLLAALTFAAAVVRRGRR